MNKKVIAGVGIVGGVIALLAGAQVYVSQAAAKEVDSAIASVSDFVDIDYEKVNASLLGGGTHVKGITIAPVGADEAFNVNEVVVYDYDEKGDIPTYLNVAVNGMALKVADLGENAAPLKEFGYDDTLSVDFATEYQYEEDEKEVRLKKFELGAEDMGDFDMTLYLSNISLDQASMASMPFSLFGMVFHEAQITYKDDSFVTRVFDTAAAANGVSVDEFKQEAIADLNQSLAEGDETLSPKLVSEMTNFINDPDGFSVSIDPESPVPVSELMSAGNAENVIKLLNVQFES